MAKRNGLEITALLVVLILLVASIVHLSNYTELDVPFKEESESYFKENSSMQTFVETQAAVHSISTTKAHEKPSVIMKENPNNKVAPGTVVVYEDGEYTLVRGGTVLTDDKLISASEEESSVLYLEN